MTKSFLFLSLLLVASSSYSQVSFPEVYTNGKKVVNGEEEGYFLPIQFKFEFQAGDTVYKIVDGSIAYQASVSYAPIQFHSNEIYTNIVAIGKSVTITIEKIEVWYKSQKVKVENVHLSKTITHKMNKNITPSEIEAVNNNDGLLLAKGKEINPNEPYSLNTSIEFEVSYKDKKKTRMIAELDAIMVRGNRPVATNNFKSNKGSASNFKNIGISGDFIWFKASGEGKSILFNKLVLIK